MAFTKLTGLIDKVSDVTKNIAEITEQKASEIKEQREQKQAEK